MAEGRGPRVPRSQGPRYLKVTFIYELTLKKVHLVEFKLQTTFIIMFEFDVVVSHFLGKRLIK